MDAYSGKYYLVGGEEMPATFVFLKDRIGIGLRDEYGNPRVVFWYYDRVVNENFWRAGYARVRYEGSPQQVIEVPSREFAEKLEEAIRRRQEGWFKKIFNSRTSALWKLALGMIVLLAAAYFWLIPFLAVKLAGRVPVSYEQQLGDRLHSVLMDGYEVNEPGTAYVNEFFREMDVASPYDIRITVVKQDVSNAFALPGGNIVIFEGILDKMSHYEELAALLSHEFMHVQNRHTTKTLFRRMGSAVFFSVLLGDFGAVGSVIVNNADRLQHLSYSRSLEKEADLEGLKILSERNIDGRGFVGLFEILKSEPGREGSEWISSHPNLDKRIRYIQDDPNFKSSSKEKETLHSLFLKLKTD